MLVIYIIGCIVSVGLAVMQARSYWKDSTKEEKVLTAALWFPFIAALSWAGTIITLFALLGHFNNLSDE